MSFYVAAAVIGFLLFSGLVYSVKQRSPVRSSLTVLGLALLFLGLAIPTAAATVRETTTPTVLDYGDAAFKRFYEQYATLLGAPVSAAAQYQGSLSEWFRFARVEFREPSDAPTHPSFPKLSLAPLGQEAARDAGLSSAKPKDVPPIVRQYIDSRLGDDFYQPGFAPLPALSRDAPLLVQNFGDAKFKDFYDRYYKVLGQPISTAGMYEGLSVQYFQYARVEYHPDYSVPLHRDFPGFQLGLLGSEYLQSRGLRPDQQVGIAPILEHWLTNNAPAQDLLYFYGNPLTNPQVDQKTGYSTQAFERAVFQWPSGSVNPVDVTRLSIGVELFSVVEQSGGIKNKEEARSAYARYFYGDPVTDVIVDSNSRNATIYYTRAAFQWPLGTVDPTEVKQLALGADLYARLQTLPPTSPWMSPFKVGFLVLSGAAFVLSMMLAVLMREGTSVYGRV